MFKRKRMSRRSSKKSFRKGAHSHMRNFSPHPMRGGYRL